MKEGILHPTSRGPSSASRALGKDLERAGGDCLQTYQECQWAAEVWAKGGNFPRSVPDPTATLFYRDSGTLRWGEQRTPVFGSEYRRKVGCVAG